jgi:hypothetical protein
VPYDECFATQLESILRYSFKNIEIINMGVLSAGPIDYLSIFINEALGYNPDMVIVHLFLGDDFVNGGTRRELHNYIRVASFAKNFMDGISYSEGRIFASGSYDDSLSVRDEISFLKYLCDIDSKCSVLDEGLLNKWFDNVAGYLAKIIMICDKSSIRYKLLISPHELQYNDDLRNKFNKKLNFKIQPDYFRLNKKIDKFSKEYQIDLFDLTPAFIANNSKGTRLVKINDPHCNIEGNYLASVYTARWLSMSIKKILETIKKHNRLSAAHCSPKHPNHQFCPKNKISESLSLIAQYIYQQWPNHQYQAIPLRSRLPDYSRNRVFSGTSRNKRRGPCSLHPALFP